jgi:hypothetical protein
MHALHPSQLQARALSISGSALRKLTGDQANASTGLTATEHAVLTALLHAMTLPDAPDLPEAHTTGALEAILKHLKYLPQSGRQQFRDLLLVFEFTAPLLIFQRTRFSKLDLKTQTKCLTACSTSKQAACRAAFQALKTLCMLGYWSQPATWNAIHYDGPTL